MGVVTRAKKRRLQEEAERLADRISNLPDDVLGDIVSLLPTRDGGRTQILSTRWRHIWRSAPLNLDLHAPAVGRRTRTDEIPHLLSTHPGPVRRRFSVTRGYFNDASHAAAMDRWLLSPALENLQELNFDLSHGVDSLSSLATPRTPAPLPTSVYRFSSSLRAASFSCCIMPDGKNAAALRFPVLKQMTLSKVSISEESSLRALLAGCTLLQSLLLYNNNYGFSRLQIVSPSLRSIGVRGCCTTYVKLELVIKDTPCLERLLVFKGKDIDISIIAAPRLGTLGKLSDITPYPSFQFQCTIFQASSAISATNVIRSVKVLVLSSVVKLSLDAVIDTLKCFPCLEKLYIKFTCVSVDNVWYHKYQKLIGTHDIRLRNVVLANYLGSKTYINFAKFFVLNARVLESMRLELKVENFSKAWIARQRSLLNINRRASRGAQITFVSRKCFIGSPDLLHVEQVHDLSIDPFERYQHDLPIYFLHV